VDGTLEPGKILEDKQELMALNLALSERIR